MTNRVSVVLALASLLAASALPAAAWYRGEVQLFATLPAGSTGPEGLTVGPDGNVYVATFGFNAEGAVSGPGKLYVFTPQGHLIRQVSIHDSSSHLLGLAFHPITGDLIVLDFGAGQALKVDPVSGASSVFMTVTGSSGLNALTFDKQGNVYVSDSFQGIIWKTGMNGGPGTVWVQDPLLTTTGVPPFGANGIQFNPPGNLMYVANTGNDTIVQIPVNADGNPGKPSVFVNSINGADGIIVDEKGNIWAAANQEDEIVVVDPTGKVIAKLGDFYDVRDDTPRGFLFPASLAFSRDGHWLYVTDLSLNLEIFGLPPAIDTAWTKQVTHYTVSRILARIPNVNTQPE
jgi:sugar lactone lactonase YvrE